MTYTFDEMDILLRAIRYAEAQHRGQTRKDATHAPYIKHPLDVMDLLWQVGEVRDVVTLAAAVLHDTIEDTDTSPEDIQALFGAQILAVVQELTDDKGLEREERKRLQIEHAPHKSPAAAQIKIADKFCNVRDVIESPPEDWSRERKIAYVQWAIDVVERLPKHNPPLEQHFYDLIAQVQTALNQE